MERLRILSLAFLIGLAWVFPLTDPFLVAQSVSDISAEFDRDEEDPVSEEDLILLQDVFLNGTGLSQLNLLLLSRVSFFSIEDASLLESYSISDKPTDILKEETISSELSDILHRLNVSKMDLVHSVHVEQMMAASDDIRYRWKGLMEFGDIHVGFLFERDPNERNMLDYASFYIEQYSQTTKWIIGDHQVLAGYGLASWRNSPPRRGFDVLSALQRNGTGLKPYKSSHEFWRTRGTGISVDSPYGSWTVSLGYNQWDGTIDSSGLLKVNETGIHSLTQEKSPSLNESSLTVVWETKSDAFTSGAIFSESSWAGGESKLHRQSGSIYFSRQQNMSHFFTELAKGHQNSYAAIAGYGINYKLFRYLLHGRYYSSGFEAFRSNPVSEWSSKNQGERGVFQSLKFGWPQNTVVLYGDLFSKITADNSFVSPESGFESGIRWIWNSKRIKTRLQWSRERKTIEDDPGYITPAVISNSQRQTLKAVYDQKINSLVKFRIQVQETAAESEGKKIIGRGVSARLWCTVQYWYSELDAVYTDVDDFGSRIYFWDINLPGEMRSTMYSRNATSAGIKVAYNTKRGWYSGIRFRVIWGESNATGSPKKSVGVFIRASV